MDIAANALAAQLASAAIAPSTEVSLALPSVAPNELASARFAAIMQTSLSATPADTAPAGTTPVNATPADAAPPSLGDRVLASLQAASDGLKNAVSAAKSDLPSDRTMGLREMMATQVEIAQMTVQYDLLGKVVSRSTQNIDQLVRVQ